MKYKLVLFLFLVSVTAGNAASANDFLVDNDTEWQEGSFTDTKASNSDLSLLDNDVRVDWNNTNYDNRLEDVEKTTETSQYVYVAGEDNNNDSAVWKYDRDGTEVEKFVEPSYNHFRSLYVTENHVFAGSTDGQVSMLDKSSLSLDKTFSQPLGFVRGIEVSSGYLYTAEGGDNMIRKIDISSNSQVWERNITNDFSDANRALGIETDSSENVYVGSERLIKYDSNGSLVTNSEDFGGEYYSVEYGDDGNIYITGGDNGFGYVAKYDESLNMIWDYGLNDRGYDLDLDTNNNVYVSTTFSDDRTYKITDQGNLVWDKGDPESQLGVESHFEGAYSAGKRQNSPERGVLTRFTEEYILSGSYTSKVFDGTENKRWNLLNVTSNLNGESAEITFQTSNDGFSTIKSSKQFTLSGGNEQFNPDINGRYARFQADLSGSVAETPRIDLVGLGYTAVAETEIVGPPEDEWQTDDFTVEVDDSGSPDECSYRINTSFGWGAWQSRSCPDGDFTIDIDTTTGCTENGFETCTVQANVTEGANYGTDTASFDIFNSSKNCAGQTIGCWLLAEGEGQALFDYSGYERHAVRGLNKTEYPGEPVWQTGSECLSTTCLRFYDDLGDETTSLEQSSFDTDNFTISADVKKHPDTSRDWIFYKDGQFALGYDKDRRLFAGVRSPDCGGWCGDDTIETSPGFVSPEKWFNTTYKPPLDEWKNIKASWNGTHMSFFEDDRLVVSKTSSKVSGYSPMARSTENFSLGYSLEIGNHANMTIDKIGITNYSTYPKLVCRGSEGNYINIGEDAEESGRLKSDAEVCLEGRTDVPHWFDQDFGDVDGDGVQETCNTDKDGVRWVSSSEIDDPSTAPAFKGGIDDDWTSHIDNLEERGQWEANISNPDATSWADDETPVPTGVPENDSVATKGFCGGDDEGEFLITQQCSTGVCSDDSSVYAVSRNPDSCTLSPGINGFTGTERKIYPEGNMTTLDYGSGREEQIACYGGEWYEKWPASFIDSDVETTLGADQPISFKLINTEPTPTRFELSLSGPMSDFARFEGEAENDVIEVPGRSSKDLTIRFSAVKEISPPESLTVQAQSLDRDFSGEDTVPVEVTRGDEGSTSFVANVPGITGLEYLILIMASSMFFYRFI